MELLNFTDNKEVVGEEDTQNIIRYLGLYRFKFIQGDNIAPLLCLFCSLTNERTVSIIKIKKTKGELTRLSPCISNFIKLVFCFDLHVQTRKYLNSRPFSK